MESSGSKRVVDIRKLGLKTLKFTLPCDSDVKSVIADENEICKIENLKKVEATLVQVRYWKMMDHNLSCCDDTSREMLSRQRHHCLFLFSSCHSAYQIMIIIN